MGSVSSQGIVLPPHHGVGDAVYRVLPMFPVCTVTYLPGLYRASHNWRCSRRRLASEGPPLRSGLSFDAAQLN